MKKRILLLAISIILVLATLSACSNNSKSTEEDDSKEAKNVTDLLGREVEIPAGVEKFVAIGPGALRLYCYVADISKLVGIEELETKDQIGRPYIYANQDLASLPIIGSGGPGNAPDPERILESEPDVIFTMYNAEVSDVDDLQNKTGIPVVAMSYGVNEVFTPEVNQSLELIGEVTGNEDRAREVVDYFAELQNDLEERVSDISEDKKPPVYMGGQGMRGAHGIESTSGNFSLFEILKARNVVAEAGIHEYIMLDKEKLLEIDPEIIFIDGGGLALVNEDYAVNKEYYQGLQAFKNNKVYMNMPYNAYYTNLGIAIADAYYMGTIMYPEEFSDINIEEKYDEIKTKLLGSSDYIAMADAYFGGYQNLKFE